MQARRFALTFYTKPDFPENKDISYFIAGEEKCPKTGKIHYQSYISLAKRYRMKALKKLVQDDTVHVEKCKGNEQQNIAYCKKDGNIYREFGAPKKQGKRNDILALRDHFKNGKRMREALEEDTLCNTVAKYQKFARMVELVYSTPRSEMTELHIYWGVSGAGKSHRAQAEGGDNAYYKPLGKNSQWWDGYEQNDVVIIEDFRGEIPLSTMLRLADKYPMRVPVKGGYAQFNSKKIIITSNIAPEDFWNNQQKGYQASFEAIRRRITSRVHYDSKWNPSQ